MRSKLFILFLFISMICVGQTSVPNTTTFSLQDVYNVVHGHAPSTTFDLNSCFANSVSGYFDSNYSTYPANSMLRFRNYTIPSCPNVGDSYMGGIVAYIYQVGDPGYVAGECHGFIATQYDLSVGIAWYNGTYAVTGATGTLLGDGLSNTNTIVTSQGVGSYAAYICYNLSQNGYSDWVLPSFDELSKILSQWNLIPNLTLYNGSNSDYCQYWTSTEYSEFSAYQMRTNYPLFGVVYGNISKGNTSTRVRPIRYF